MSYNPPNKTKYGDELIDDTIPSSTSNLYSTQNNYGSQQTPSQIISQPIHYPPAGDQSISPVSPDKLQTIAAIKNREISPEDMLFMRKWQQDALIYRVIPLSVLGSALLVYRQKKKNLPPKLGHHALAFVGAYFLGKFSYMGELKRRVANSPSSSPFLNGLRMWFKLPAKETGEFSSDYASGYSPESLQTGDWGSALESSRAQDLNTVGPTNPDYANMPAELTQSGNFKQQLTYDELRSRNRGVIK